ncbi:MAG TPA: hypothetical protein VL527_05765 [Dongiaceae bacterium]|nr:hypothetical protein [Dongiaceae bacterium]
MDTSIPFAGREYLFWLTLLVWARGMDFLSTWIATPRLVLEGNPIARWLGWQWGAVANLGLCLWLAQWPVTAIAVGTASVLVAARNFQSAWLMRSLGEEAYRDWHVRRILAAPLPLYLFCLAGNTLLTAVVGATLVACSSTDQYLLVVPFGIGLGVLAYAAAVILYSLLSFWRIRRNRRNHIPESL